MLSKKALCQKHFGVDDVEFESKTRYEHLDAEDTIPAQEWVKLTLPYYAPDPSLPPIPTAEDVEMARSEEYINNPDSHSGNPFHVYRLNSVYAVKFGRSKRLLQEAENLLFLQEQKVRTPKVYAVFSHQGADPLGYTIGAAGYRRKPRSELGTYYYIVMEYLDGVTLKDETWEHQFGPEARVKIYGKIAEQLELLRSIPAPHPSYYGRIHHQPYEPLCPPVRHLCRDFVGPFDSYADFLQQVWKTFEANAVRSRLLNHSEITYKMNILAECFDSFFNNAKHGEPILSHMNLRIRNMRLVKSPSNPSTQLEDYDLCILDWRSMCWLPAWVEIAGAEYNLPQSPEGENMRALREIFKGMEPFPYAEAYTYRECAGAFGGVL